MLLNLPKDVYGRTPFHRSILDNRWKVFDRYLDHAGDDKLALVHHTDNLDSSAPLHFAALASQDPYITLRLIEAGADVNKRDDMGDTPLILAARWNKLAILMVLLENGADPTPQSYLVDTTALHAAAERGCIGAILPLIRHGAIIDAKDVHGNTALHLASKAVLSNSACLSVVDRLLALGANPTITKRSEETPDAFARSNSGTLNPWSVMKVRSF